MKTRHFIIAGVILILLSAMSIHFYLREDLKRIVANDERLPLKTIEHHHHPDDAHVPPTDNTRDTGRDATGQKTEMHQQHPHPHEHGQWKAVSPPTQRYETRPSHTEDLQTLQDWGLNLPYRMSEKYPDVMAVHTLTDEEFARRYPTEADKQYLQQRMAEMEEEVSRERRELFSRFSDEDYKSLLTAIHAELTELWDASTAEK